MSAEPFTETSIMTEPTHQAITTLLETLQNTPSVAGDNLSEVFTLDASDVTEDAVTGCGPVPHHEHGWTWQYRLHPLLTEALQRADLNPEIDVLLLLTHLDKTDSTVARILLEMIHRREINGHHVPRNLRVIAVG